MQRRRRTSGAPRCSEISSATWQKAAGFTTCSRPTTTWPTQVTSTWTSSATTTGCPSNDAGMASMKKVRADQLLVQRGLAESRARAQALVLAGQVFTGPTLDIRVEKAGQLLGEAVELEVRGASDYVSRGGLKLE